MIRAAITNIQRLAFFNSALFSLIAIEILGVVSLAALFASRRSTGLSKPFVAAVLGISIIAGGLMAWTANLGGQIRHTEIRSGVLAGSTEGEEAGEHPAAPKKEKKDDDE